MNILLKNISDIHVRYMCMSIFLKFQFFTNFLNIFFRKTVKTAHCNVL